MARLLENLKYVTMPSPWIIGPLVFVLWILVLLTVKRSLLRSIKKRLAGNASLIWANAVVEAMSPTLTIAIWVGGIAVLDRILPLSARADHMVGIILAAGITLALVIFVDRIAHRLLLQLAMRSEALHGAFHLVHGIARAIFITLGALIFLESVGIAITPIIASLGIGTLAVALALQDTLANLFAGIYMIAEKPIAAGNFIKLEGGEQGHVMKVGWRSTHLRMLGDSVVVVPNTKLAGNVITNFSLPKDEVVVTIEVGVSYQCDLEHVQSVTLEIAREVAGVVPGAVPAVEPRLRFHTFGDSSINLTVFIQVQDFVCGLDVKHELMKRLHARYRRERIDMPFPTRTVELGPDTLAGLGLLIQKEAANGMNANRIQER
jgi:small-conductance mechanosensitive channel